MEEREYLRLFGTRPAGWTVRTGRRIYLSVGTAFHP